MHDHIAGWMKGVFVSGSSFGALIFAGVDEKMFAAIVSLFLGLLMYNVNQVLSGVKRNNRKMDSVVKRLIAVQHAVTAIIASNPEARAAVENTAGEHLHILLSPPRDDDDEDEEK